MNEEKKKTDPGILKHSLLAAAVLLCILLVILVHKNPGMNPYAYAPYSFYLMEPETVTEEPAENGMTTSAYEFTVPDGAKVRHGARLSIYLQHSFAKVWLDGELMYSSWEKPESHIGRTPGNYWLTAALRSDYSGRKLRIEITPVYKSSARAAWYAPLPQASKKGQPQFLLIDHEQLLARLVFPKDAAILITAFFVLAAGLFLSLFSLIAKLERADKERLFYLGAASASAAVWNLSQLPSLLLALDIYGLQKTVWHLGAGAYVLVPLFTVLLIASLQTQPSAGISSKAFFICFAGAAAVTVLQILNICDLYVSMFWYGVLGTVIIAVLVLGTRKGSGELLRQAAFPAAFCIDLVIFRATGSARFATAVLLWMAVSLCLRGAGFVSEAFEREKKLRSRDKEIYEIRLRSLVQQIRPHFIYNTLSSIYVLCKKGSPRTLQVIDDFLAYLQANFTGMSAEEPVPFSDELKHTKAYLAVESIRFEGLLKVDYDTPHTDFRLPPLTLQPIVENSVKHGIHREHFQIHISIKTRLTEGGSEIIVEDNGPGFELGADTKETSPQASAGGEARIGLKNVSDRLRLMCGGSLTAVPRPEGGTVVTILIPNSGTDSCTQA